MQVKVYKEQYLIEMAMSRKDALIKVSDLAPKFVEHFDKIYNDIDSDAILHWAAEMQAWLNYVLNIKLKETKKPLSLQQKMDWFFTCGSDSETLFKDNLTEAEVYDDFIDSIVITDDVIESLKVIGLLDD